MIDIHSADLNGNGVSTPAPWSPWREIGKREHFVQFYENDNFLAECVAEYIAAGLAAKENTMVVATRPHQIAITDKLHKKGIDATAAMQRCQYLQFDAEETLSMFMIGGMPDERRFFRAISGLFSSAAPDSKGMRIYGEMVALLLAACNVKASIRLEEMWNDFAKTHVFSLFCGYPINAFSSPADEESFKHICKEHSHVLTASSLRRTSGKSEPSLTSLQQET